MAGVHTGSTEIAHLQSVLQTLEQHCLFSHLPFYMECKRLGRHFLQKRDTVKQNLTKLSLEFESCGFWSVLSAHSSRARGTPSSDSLK